MRYNRNAQRAYPGLTCTASAGRHPAEALFLEKQKPTTRVAGFAIGSLKTLPACGYRLESDHSRSSAHCLYCRVSSCIGLDFYKLLFGWDTPPSVLVTQQDNTEQGFAQARARSSFGTPR